MTSKHPVFIAAEVGDLGVTCNVLRHFVRQSRVCPVTMAVKRFETGDLGKPLCGKWAYDV